MVLCNSWGLTEVMEVIEAAPAVFKVPRRTRTLGRRTPAFFIRRIIFQNALGEIGSCSTLHLSKCISCDPDTDNDRHFCQHCYVKLLGHSFSSTQLTVLAHTSQVPQLLGNLTWNTPLDLRQDPNSVPPCWSKARSPENKADLLLMYLPPSKRLLRILRTQACKLRGRTPAFFRRIILQNVLVRMDNATKQKTKQISTDVKEYILICYLVLFNIQLWL